MNPRIVVEGYLDADERQEILDSIYRLKEHWYQYFRLFHDKFYLLPLGLYPQDPRYAELKQAARESMADEFGWVYGKLVKTFEEWYGKPVVFSPNLNYPGFHVYFGPFSNKDVDPEIGWHVDSFPFVPELKDQHIESWVLPIQLPKEDTGIYWKNDWEDGPDQWRTFTYIEGALGQWQGQMPHRIGNLVLGEDDPRITMQMHTCIKEESVTLFW